MYIDILSMQVYELYTMYMHISILIFFWNIKMDWGEALESTICEDSDPVATGFVNNWRL